MSTSLAIPDSLLSFRNSQGIESRGTIMQLSRQMAVFEVYNPYSIVQLSEVLLELRIRQADRIVYAGKAVVSNLVNTGLMLIVSATLVDSWSNLASVPPGMELRGEVQHFVQGWQQTHQALRPDFIYQVSAFRNFLEELNRWLSHGEMLAGIGTGEADEALRRQFSADVEGEVIPILSQFYATLEGHTRSIPPEQAMIHRAFTQSELHPLLLCSPFMHRTYSKPLGYAGDYEMVNMMLRDPAEGQNTYARLINVFNLGQGPSAAHRNRIDLLERHLANEAVARLRHQPRFAVMNIGCGPAHEVQRFCANHPQAADCDFTMLDFNAETLAHTADRLKQIGMTRRMPTFTWVHQSIHALLKEALGRTQEEAPRYDMVYCAGLFDYLSDKICQRLLRLFSRWVKPGGLILATNVHSDNPIRGMMEYILEWHLIYRDEAGMQALTPPGWTCTLERDATGINIFSLCRRDGDPSP